MIELATLFPKDEQVWVTHRNKEGELLFFLTSPSRSTSTLAAQTGAFSLYAVNGKKAKKLGQGGNPTELELKYGVREKMTV